MTDDREESVTEDGQLTAADLRNIALQAAADICRPYTYGDHQMVIRAARDILAFLREG